MKNIFCMLGIHKYPPMPLWLFREKIKTILGMGDGIRRTGTLLCTRCGKVKEVRV